MSIASPPREAESILVEIALQEGWVESKPEAAEKAETWGPAFLKRVRRELSELVQLGRVTHFAINSSSDTMIQGAAFVEVGVDSAEAKAAKEKRAEFGEYLSVFPQLTPDNFETLCKKILAAIGVVDLAVTPHGNDQGIDFFGRLRLGDVMLGASTLPSVYDVMHVWMVGQAKHYQATQVATPDIREVVGSVNLAKSKAYGTPYDFYPDLNIRVCDPVFYLFFTTGRISADGWRLLAASGVVGMDGEMVAAFLADHGLGHAEVDEFVQWLADDGAG